METYTIGDLCNMYQDDSKSFEQYFAEQVGLDLHLIMIGDLICDNAYELLENIYKNKQYTIIPNHDYIKFRGKLNSDFRISEQ